MLYFDFRLQLFNDDTVAPPAGDPPTDPPAGGLLSDPPAGDPPTDPPADGKEPPKDPAKTSEEPPKDPAKTSEEPPPGPPESYTDFTFPEGVTAAPESMEAFKNIAKETGLTQEAAQKLVDFQTKIVQAQNEQLSQQFTQTVESWKAETMKTLGVNAKEELAIAKKGFDTYASDGLKEVLGQFGLDNHKDVIAHFGKLGRDLQEDKFHEGGTRPKGDVEWFPNSKK